MTMLETIAWVSAIIGELGVILGVTIPVFHRMSKLSNGAKCQLRSEMLQIYYRNNKEEHIRQFEYENFVMLYEAYKALKGNSFIDKIYREVQTWEISS